jgi:hypothetical protein
LKYAARPRARYQLGSYFMASYGDVTTRWLMRACDQCFVANVQFYERRRRISQKHNETWIRYYEKGTAGAKSKDVDQHRASNRGQKIEVVELSDGDASSAPRPDFATRAPAKASQDGEWVVVEDTNAGSSHHDEPVPASARAASSMLIPIA